jgi:hypothetical protein
MTQQIYQEQISLLERAFAIINQSEGLKGVDDSHLEGTNHTNKLLLSDRFGGVIEVELSMRIPIREPSNIGEHLGVDELA